MTFWVLDKEERTTASNHSVTDRIGYLWGNYIILRKVYELKGFDGSEALRGKEADRSIFNW